MRNAKMVESWIVYGLLASLFFGTNAVVYKYAAVNGSLNPFYASVFFGAGIFLSFLVAYLFKFSAPTTNFKWLGIALFAGVLWGLGFIMIAIAVSKGFDIAKLAPIYNTNTLITIILGIVLLKELPSAAAMWKVIIGAAFIVVGALIVSIK